MCGCLEALFDVCGTRLCRHITPLLCDGVGGVSAVVAVNGWRCEPVVLQGAGGCVGPCGGSGCANRNNGSLRPATGAKVPW